MANTIADKLTYLSGTKEAIKQSIIGKGVDVSDTDTFRSYADKISSIQAGGSTVNLPDGTKFAYSKFTTVPDSIIPYLESQNSMDYMFYACSSLQTVSLFDTSRVTTMSSMYDCCESLQTVSQFDTSKCTDISWMFNCCFSLTTVPLLDTNNVNSTDSVFSECSSLTNLGGFTGLKQDLDLQSSPLLSVESVMNVINNAADMSSSPRTLTLHSDVFAKLSDEQIATASAKGWNIASA